MAGPPSSTKFFTDRFRLTEAAESILNSSYKQDDLRQLIDVPYKGHKHTRAARETLKRRAHGFEDDHREMKRICTNTVLLFDQWCGAREWKARQARFLGRTQSPGILRIQAPLETKNTMVSSAGITSRDEMVKGPTPKFEEGTKLRPAAKAAQIYLPNRVSKKTTMPESKRYLCIKGFHRAVREGRSAPKRRGATKSQIADDFRLIELKRAEFAQEKRERRSEDQLIAVINRLRQHGFRNNSTELPPRQPVKESEAETGPLLTTRSNGKIILNLRVLELKAARHNRKLATSFRRLHSTCREPADDYFTALRKEAKKPCLSAEEVDQIQDKFWIHTYGDLRRLPVPGQEIDLKKRINNSRQQNVRKAMNMAKDEVSLKRKIVSMIRLTEKLEEAMDVGVERDRFTLNAVPLVLRHLFKKGGGTKSSIPTMLTRIEHASDSTSNWTVGKRSQLREEVFLGDIVERGRK